MNKRLVKITLAVGMAVSLTACNSFFGTHLFSRHAARTAEATAPRASAPAEPAVTAVTAAAAKNDAAIGEGRKHLAAGNYGLAIDTFRTAMANGEPAAPALNGLGVAYAHIGRFDLAQRYFLEAIQADPGDERYAANLTRLMRSPAMAMRRDGDVGAALLRDEAARQNEAQAQPAIAVAAPQKGRLSKVSSHEFHIATLAPAAAPRATTGTKAAAGFKPLVRLQFSRTGGAVDPVNVVGFRPIARIMLRDASPPIAATSRASVALGTIR